MGGGLSRKEKTPWDPVRLHVRPSCGSEGALRPRPRFLSPFLRPPGSSPPRADPCRQGPDPPRLLLESSVLSSLETTCHDCSTPGSVFSIWLSVKNHTLNIKPRKDTERLNSTPVGKASLRSPTRCTALPRGPLWKHSCRRRDQGRQAWVQGAQHRAPRALGPLCPAGGSAALHTRRTVERPAPRGAT